MMAMKKKKTVHNKTLRLANLNKIVNNAVADANYKVSCVRKDGSVVIQFRSSEMQSAQGQADGFFRFAEILRLDVERKDIHKIKVDLRSLPAS